MTPPDGATVAAARNPRLCPPPSVDRSTQPSQPSTYHRQRHRLVTLVPSALLLLYSLLLLSSLRACRASSVVATWVHLLIDPSTAPTVGFCDQWVGVDAAHERLVMVGGDNGFNGTGPEGTWILDYSTSFTSPVWLNLSAVDSPYVGGGPQGALVSSESTLASSFVAHHPELIVWGGHSLLDTDFFNVGYDGTLSNTTATWTLGPNPAAMPEVAWATSAWGNVEQTMLFMYGGTGTVRSSLALPALRFAPRRTD